jgi:hypothetical protein
MSNLGAAGSYLLEHIQAVVNFVGFSFAVLTFVVTSRKDRDLQQRRNYLTLELECSRIFNVCFENPSIARYISGELSEEETKPEMPEKAYWLIPQILNVLEISLSFREEGMIPKDVFITWVPWFYELGTAARFRDFWDVRNLKFNYKPELGKIIDAARDLPGDSALAKLEEFHKRVAGILKDQSILEHFKASLSAHSAAR